MIFKEKMASNCNHFDNIDVWACMQKPLIIPCSGFQLLYLLCIILWPLEYDEGDYFLVLTDTLLSDWKVSKRYWYLARWLS